MNNTCSISITKKEQDLQGLIRLLKESSASISAYCSLALRYYIENNEFLQVGTVVPVPEGEMFYISIYMDDELLNALSSYMKKLHIKNRSKLIKNILSGSVRTGEKAQLVPEFELRRSMLEPKQKTVDCEIRSEIKTEYPMQSGPEEAAEDQSEEAQSSGLLDNLFGNISSQMEKW